MAEKMVDFEAVKQRVTMYMLLRDQGLYEELTEEEGADGKLQALTGRCPIHTDNVEGVFTADCRKNTWRCKGGEECGEHGDVITFVAKRNGITSREAAVLIAEWFELEGVEYHRKAKSDAESKPAAGKQGREEPCQQVGDKAKRRMKGLRDALGEQESSVGTDDEPAANTGTTVPQVMEFAEAVRLVRAGELLPDNLVVLTNRAFYQIVSNGL